MGDEGRRAPFVLRVSRSQFETWWTQSRGFAVRTVQKLWPAGRPRAVCLARRLENPPVEDDGLIGLLIADAGVEEDRPESMGEDDLVFPEDGIAKAPMLDHVPACLIGSTNVGMPTVLVTSEVCPSGTRREARIAKRPSGWIITPQAILAGGSPGLAIIPG